MFRPIFAQARKSFGLAVSNTGYCSKPVTRALPEINECKLSGTLISDAFVLQSGTKALTLRTMGAGDHYQTHTVYTRGFDTLKAGQRVHVSGRLSTQPFQLDNGKQRDRVMVQAQRIFVLEEDADNKSKTDRNQVYLAGNIATEVVSTDKVTIFKVATHHINNRSEESESKAEFHSIFVEDDKLREYVKSLKMRDRVVIEGELRHNTHTAADGKKKHSGYIAATNIGKIARLNKNVEEHHDIDRETNN